mmetsp:Transcript_97807/g.273812  ORF Transcript_97807/g.273812 Transcript_97807/m.273812 type:complete len:232 (+) Transcript_97807:1590-2285(+)
MHPSTVQRHSCLDGLRWTRTFPTPPRSNGAKPCVAQSKTNSWRPCPHDMPAHTPPGARSRPGPLDGRPGCLPRSQRGSAQTDPIKLPAGSRPAAPRSLWSSSSCSPHSTRWHLPPTAGPASTCWPSCRARRRARTTATPGAGATPTHRSVALPAEPSAHACSARRSPRAGCRPRRRNGPEHRLPLRAIWHRAQRSRDAPTAQRALLVERAQDRGRVEDGAGGSQSQTAKMT